jgi:predicted esterase
VSEHHLSVTRTARYHTLGDSAPDTRDVWIACHGFGQLAAEFVRELEPIAAPGRLIVAPEALNRFYLDDLETRRGTPGRVGATWMTREDRLAEIDDYVAYLDRLAERVLAPLPSDVRVRALGFSQGVATVCRWVARGAPRVRELILWAGAIPPELASDAFAARLRALRVTLVVGERDRFASWSAVEEETARLRAAGVEPEVIRFAGGHRMDRGTLERIAAASR